MNEVLKAINERSSTRGYTEEKLCPEILDKLIKAGLEAPTAANKQELHFSVIDGKAQILQEIEDEKNRGFGLEQAPPNNFYYSAPTVIIISGDKNFGWSALDAGIAVENIAIAAQSLGLGSLIIGCIKNAMLGEKGPEFGAKLGIPEDYEYEIAIALGYKAVTKEPHTYTYERQVTIVE